MEYRIIKSPTQGTLDILTRRKGSGAGREIGPVDAVEDIRGNCPQNMILLAIFGDTASVEAAMDEIRRREKEGREEW